MALFKDYLALKAKFYSPPLGGKPTSTSEVNIVEVNALERAWVPSSGRHDPNLVDSLLKTLDDYLGDRPLPLPQIMLDINFQPFVDHNGRAWRINEFESQARFMVESGAIVALVVVMDCLGHVIHRHPDQSPPGFGSRVDFNILGSNHKKVLIEIKAPSVLEGVLPIFEREAIRIELRNSIPEEAVLNKACLYMASHKARWLALTSHNNWVFLRLHDDIDDPYITYSTIEQQADNTRPFRALLGMMLASECDLNVESNADLTVELPPTTEEYKPEDRPGELDQQDKSGLYRRKGRSTREEPPVLQSHKADQLVAGPSLLVSWAESDLRDTNWMSCLAVEGTEWCSSLGAEPVRLRIQRLLGRGSTGTVFEAKHDVEGCSEALRSRSYAFKTVAKGKSEEKKRQIQRLFTEFSIYCNIEQARRNGKICNASPRCYGLFEMPSILVLIVDYEGESLDGTEWASLEYQEKAEIFNAIRELHEIGVGHYDLEPRNIVHNASGRYKIIDFSSGAMHHCLGMKQNRGSSSVKYGKDECRELKVMWWNLMRQ